MKELQDLSLEEAEVRAVVDRLRANAAFLAWLPRVRGLQLDQIYANRGRLENARSLLGTLQGYVVGLERIDVPVSMPNHWVSWRGMAGRFDECRPARRCG